MDSVHHPAPHPTPTSRYPTSSHPPEYADYRVPRQPTTERAVIRRFLIVNVVGCALIAGVSITGGTWLAAPVLGQLPVAMALFAVQGGVFLATAWRFDRHSRTTPDGSSQAAGSVLGSDL